MRDALALELNGHRRVAVGGPHDLIREVVRVLGGSDGNAHPANPGEVLKASRDLSSLRLEMLITPLLAHAVDEKHADSFRLPWHLEALRASPGFFRAPPGTVNRLNREFVGNPTTGMHRP